MRNVKMVLTLGASNIPCSLMLYHVKRSHLKWVAAPCPPLSALPAAGSANGGEGCSNTAGVGT